jgi:hypothetical protein
MYSPFEFMPLRFPSPIRAPLVTSEDVRAPKARDTTAPGQHPLPVLACPRSIALHNHTSICIQAAAMNPVVLPFEADRGMLHLPLCAATNPPDPLRADDLPRPTTTPCNTQETQGAQRLLFYIRVFLQRHHTFLPQQDYGDVPPFPRFLRLLPNRAADARDAEIFIFISTVP